MLSEFNFKWFISAVFVDSMQYYTSCA